MKIYRYYIINGKIEEQTVSVVEFNCNNKTMKLSSGTIIPLRGLNGGSMFWNLLCRLNKGKLR